MIMSIITVIIFIILITIIIIIDNDNKMIIIITTILVSAFGCESRPGGLCFAERMRADFSPDGAS